MLATKNLCNYCKNYTLFTNAISGVVKCDSCQAIDSFVFPMKSQSSQNRFQIDLENHPNESKIQEKIQNRLVQQIENTTTNLKKPYNNITHHYASLMTTFCYNQDFEIPEQLISISIKLFIDIMYNVWLDGKGPNMAMAVALYHVINRKCKMLISDEMESDTYINNFFNSFETHEKDFQFNLVKYFLLDLKHTGDCSQLSRHKALIKGDHIICKIHNCLTPQIFHTLQNTSQEKKTIKNKRKRQ